MPACGDLREVEGAVLQRAGGVPDPDLDRCGGVGVEIQAEDPADAKALKNAGGVVDGNGNVVVGSGFTAVRNGTVPDFAGRMRAASGAFPARPLRPARRGSA